LYGGDGAGDEVTSPFVDPVEIRLITDRLWSLDGLVPFGVLLRSGGWKEQRMRRRFLIACGVILVAAPLLWVFYFLTTCILVYCYEGYYPPRPWLGTFVLSLIPGAIMVIAGLDIVGAARYSK
jgi:hypothetical protein